MRKTSIPRIIPINAGFGNFFDFGSRVGARPGGGSGRLNSVRRAVLLNPPSGAFNVAFPVSLLAVSAQKGRVYENGNSRPTHNLYNGLRNLVCRVGFCVSIPDGLFFILIRQVHVVNSKCRRGVAFGVVGKGATHDNHLVSFHNVARESMVGTDRLVRGWPPLDPAEGGHGEDVHVTVSDAADCRRASVQIA